MIRKPIAFVTLSLLSLSIACADDYPSRPINFIVPFAAGGPADFVGRVLAENMSKTLGKQLVIENVGGAGGTTGAARIARAVPDGYTIMIYNQGFAAAPASIRSCHTIRLRISNPSGWSIAARWC